MILEYIKLSIDELFANKLRSFLSLIGIVIGVAVVFVIFSIADIAQAAITNSLTNSNGVVTIQYTEDTKQDEDSKMMNQMMAVLGAGTAVNYHFTQQDIMSLTNLDGVEAAFANYSTMQTVRIEDRNRNAQIRRYSDQFMIFYDLTLISGQPLDLLDKMNMALVDSSFVSNYTSYSEQEILGQQFKIGSRVFKIAGVVKSDNTGMNNMVFLHDNAYDSLYSRGTIQNISIKVSARYDLDEVSQAATSLLNEVHGTQGTDAIYEVQDLSSIMKSITSVTGILSTVMAIIASISLLVAGIGVMNIMFVSVVERTREIGVKRALGASKNAIRIQFMVESSLLTLIGGVMGILLGIGIILIALQILNLSLPINITYIVYALLFSISLGIAFGYFPAKRAADLNIIEAIATE